MQSTNAAQRAGLAEPDRPRSDEASTAANGQGLGNQTVQDAEYFQASGAADQAALVIEGEAYGLAYLAPLHSGVAQPGDLATVLAFMSGEMLQGAYRAIEKALEGRHHA